MFRSRYITTSLAIVTVLSTALLGHHTSRFELGRSQAESLALYPARPVFAQTLSNCGSISCDYRYTIVVHTPPMHRAAAGQSSDGWLVWRSSNPTQDMDSAPIVPLKFKATWCASNGGETCQACVNAEGMLMSDGSIMPIGTWPTMASNCPIAVDRRPMTAVVNKVSAGNFLSTLECNDISLTGNTCFADSDWQLDIFPKVVASNSPTPYYFRTIVFQATPAVEAELIQGMPNCPTTDGYSFFYTPNDQPWEGVSRSEFETPEVGTDPGYFSDYCYEVHFRKP